MRFDAEGRPVEVLQRKDRQPERLPRLTATFLTAMLGAGMGLTFYGLGALEGETVRSGVGSPPLPPTPLPTATFIPVTMEPMVVWTPVLVDGLPLVLVATATPRPTSTPNLTPPPTPFVRPTATPYPACGPCVEAGRVCTMPEPAPTSDALPEQP